MTQIEYLSETYLNGNGWKNKQACEKIFNTKYLI